MPQPRPSTSTSCTSLTHLVHLAAVRALDFTAGHSQQRWRRRILRDQCAGRCGRCGVTKNAEGFSAAVCLVSGLWFRVLLPPDVPLGVLRVSGVCRSNNCAVDTDAGAPVYDFHWPTGPSSVARRVVLHLRTLLAEFLRKLGRVHIQTPGTVGICGWPGVRPIKISLGSPGVLAAGPCGHCRVSLTRRAPAACQRQGHSAIE